MAIDTPFDPDLIPRLIVGEPTPTMPFAPPRNQAEPFTVRDEASANWVVRKIVGARNYAERVKEYADRELKRASREEQFYLEHYGPALEQWARQQMTKSGRRLKRVRLPAGAIGYRATQTRLKIVDEDKLLQWCRENLPDAIVRSERVIKMLLNERFEKTGECPGGVDVVPAADRFFVK